MNDAESRILSILRPGDMVRFSVRPDKDRKIEVGIEGAPAEAGDGFLEERLTLALREMRGHGYLFGPRTQPTGSKSGTPRAGRKRRKATRWIEIRPLSLHVSPLGSDSLGFGTSGEGRVALSVRLPDVQRSLGGGLPDGLAAFVCDVREIDLLEVDFTRVELPAGCVRSLEDSLKLHAEANAAVAAALREQSLAEAFLGLWLSYRGGWKVSARTLVSGAGKLPIAALEMIGRDLYRCECKTHVDLMPAEESDSAHDMSAWFPCGWPFPSILPGQGSTESFAARRFHNVSLPGLPKSGTVIGTADGIAVRLPRESRDRHTYMVGATGTGKSTLLARMIREDMKAGEGVIVLEPHGDLHAETLSAVPRSRQKDLLVIDPLHEDTSPGMNILDVPPGALRKRHTELLIGELIGCFKGMWDNPEAFGPMFEVFFRNALTLLMLQEGEPRTLADFDRVFADSKFRAQLVDTCTDPLTKSFWSNTAEKLTGDGSIANVTPYITCKTSPLTQSAFLATLLLKPRDDVRLAERINRAPIILVNLNKGVLGVHESRILGVILMAQIMGAGLKRSLLRQRDRTPVNVYVDEFQNFVSDKMAAMLSEARKFGLRLTLANQTLSQLRAHRGSHDVLETVLGNVGNMILFRLGVADADRLRLFLEPFSRQDMQDLPNFHALLRLLTSEGPVRPLIMQTLKP